jgi:hypothetical protein
MDLVGDRDTVGGGDDLSHGPRSIGSGRLPARDA